MAAALSEAKRRSNAKWDAENMAYQTVKIPVKLRDAFKAACAARGERVNTVLRRAMEEYVAQHSTGQDTGGEN